MYCMKKCAIYTVLGGLINAIFHVLMNIVILSCYNETEARKPGLMPILLIENRYRKCNQMSHALVLITMQGNSPPLPTSYQAFTK